MDRKRVYDWPGGSLRIVQVLDLGVARTETEIGSGEYVPFGPGLALPQPLLQTLKDCEGELLAEVEVGIVNGRPGCVGLRALGGNELSSTLLRNISPMIRRLVRELVRNHAVRIIRTEDGLIGERYVGTEGFTLPADALGDIQVEAEEILEASPHSAPRTVDADFLREVADVYRTAFAQPGLSTQREIQRQLGPTSGSNARRWVMRARTETDPLTGEKFLGPAPGKRGGEKRKDENND